MARKKSFQTSSKTEEINISPLIDMVFILLIFFIVTTVFVDERGFEASKPEDSQQEDKETEPIIFKVTSGGEVHFSRTGENIGISGVNRIIRNHMTEEDLSVIIQVESGSRAEVAVRVFDEALRAGAAAVNLKEAR